MYVPNHYRGPSAGAALEVIREFPLATVISVIEGSPFVSYLPLTIASAEPSLVLSGHCARANPHWTHFADGPVYVLFRGPEGYISPRFYQDCSVNVPSWNYVAVHCTGTARVAPPDETDGILRALVDRMEAPAANPWRMEDLTGEHFDNLKKAIVPFSVRVSKIESKFKLSQRGSDGDVAGLIAGLRETGSDGDRRLADAMEASR